MTTTDPSPAARMLLLVLGPIVGGLAIILAMAQPSAAAAGPCSAAIADEAQPTGVWPLDPQPEVLAGFDPPADPWGAGHRGVDLLGHPGQSVRSALAGTVAFVGKIAGKPVVTVTHGAQRTTYEPVVASVSRGDAVAAGQVIGHLQVTFSHCFPRACLHWGLLEGETYLDPLSLVGSAHVRLLPLWRDEPVGSHLMGGDGPASGSAGAARRCAASVVWPLGPAAVWPLGAATVWRMLLDQARGCA